jgi:hypothetical protein
MGRACPLNSGTPTLPRGPRRRRVPTRTAVRGASGLGPGGRLVAGGPRGPEPHSPGVAAIPVHGVPVGVGAGGVLRARAQR